MLKRYESRGGDDERGHEHDAGQPVRILGLGLGEQVCGADVCQHPACQTGQETERAFSWQNPLIRQLLILTALNLYFGFSVPNVSNTAHIGGLVGGAAFGWFTAPTVYSSKTLRAATPTVILFGAELILLALWLLL